MNKDVARCCPEGWEVSGQSFKRERWWKVKITIEWKDLNLQAEGAQQELR